MPQILPRLGRRGRGADLPARLSPTARAASAMAGLPEAFNTHRRRFSNAAGQDTSHGWRISNRGPCLVGEGLALPFCSVSDGNPEGSPTPMRFGAARQTVPSGPVEVGLRAGRGNLGGRRHSALSPLLPPSRAFLGFHFLLLETLDFSLSFLKSCSLSTCHASSFHRFAGDRIRAGSSSYQRGSRGERGPRKLSRPPRRFPPKPPPPGRYPPLRSGLGRASLMVSARPPNSLPFRVAIAFAASSS
jgi:hypothetical protein